MNSIKTDKKTNTVSPSWKMIVKMKTAKPNSITLIHNHSKGTTFSITDIISLNNTSSLKELIVKGNNRSEYYFSIPESARIDLRTKEKKDQFKKHIKILREDYKKQGIGYNEAFEKVWEDVAKAGGWLYGKK